MVALCFVNKATSTPAGRQRGAVLGGKKSAQWSRRPLCLWAFTCCSVRFSLTNQMAEKSEFIPLWNNTGHVKADWSVCRKRSWSKEDRDGKDVFMMSVLCELLFHFLSEWVFSFYFSPILLSLYHVSEPCGRLGTELMAARPDPVPQKVKRNLTAQKFRNIWIKTIQKLIQEVKIEGQRQFLVRMCPCVH